MITEEDKYCMIVQVKVSDRDVKKLLKNLKEEGLSFQGTEEEIQTIVAFFVSSMGVISEAWSDALNEDTEGEMLAALQEELES